MLKLTRISVQTTLCDCPGLVLPSLVMSTAEMLVAGILPVDQMRDASEAVRLVVERTSFDTLQVSSLHSTRRRRFKLIVLYAAEAVRCAN